MAPRSAYATLMTSSLLANGCVVAEPPPYEPPALTPPLLNLQQATPRLSTPVPVDRETDVAPDERQQVEFFVPLRSEDRGEPLWYAFHLDYDGTDPQRSVLLKNEISPSTLDDTSRAISRTWRVTQPVTDGCHRVTLFVAHYSNWLTGEDRPDPDGDKNDVAMATWWINVNPAPGERLTLRNCPSGRIVEQ